MKYTSYRSGLTNGDLRLRDHAVHEGLKARAAMVAHDIEGGALNSRHYIPSDSHFR